MTSGVTCVPLPEVDEKILRSTQSGGPVWSDQRRSVRYPSNARCVVESEGTYATCELSHGSQEVLLRDLSRGGMRFLHGAQIYPGERFVICIGRDRRLTLEAVWCRRVAPGVFVTGCRFVTPTGRDIAAS